MKNLQTITSFRTQHLSPTTISTKHNSANTHCQSAHTVTSCHTTSDKCPNTWNIDYGASTRMTRNSNIIESYVSLWNGQYSCYPWSYDTSSRTWHFSLSLVLPLSNMVHVSSLIVQSLFVNLLFPTSLEILTNYVVTFFPCRCVFRI